VPAVVQIVAADGLVTTLSNKDGDLNWLVDRQTLRLQIQTVIPSKQYNLNGPAVVLAEQQPGQENTNFGVGPVGIKNEDFQSSLDIRITSAEDSVFHAVKVLGNVAKAMWEYRSTDGDGRPQVGDPLNQTTIANVLIGFELFPYVQSPDHTQKIPLQPLQYTIDEQIQPIDWSTPVVETTDPFNAETVAGTIAIPPASTNRPALLAAMKRAGLTVGARPIDITTLAAANSNYLLAPPALRYLGEAK